MHVASFGNFHESQSQTLMIEIEQFAHDPWFNDHFAVLSPFLSKAFHFKTNSEHKNSYS